MDEQTVIDRLPPNWVPVMELPQRLMLLRKRLGWTIPQIASICGYSQATWSSWERGAVPRDTLGVVQRIADATKCDAEWLMFGEAQNRKEMSVAFPLKSDTEDADTLGGVPALAGARA